MASSLNSLSEGTIIHGESSQGDAPDGDERPHRTVRLSTVVGILMVIVMAVALGGYIGGNIVYNRGYNDAVNIGSAANPTSAGSFQDGVQQGYNLGYTSGWADSKAGKTPSPRLTPPAHPTPPQPTFFQPTEDTSIEVIKVGGEYWGQPHGGSWTSLKLTSAPAIRSCAVYYATLKAGGATFENVATTPIPTGTVPSEFKNVCLGDPGFSN